jgi:2,3-bisphosphoglycerate-independent phosphoglycerate mutase
MAQASIAPVVLVILDGWGYRENAAGNAIAAAKTPVMDSLWAAYPRTLIQASGRDVGLPDGQMGNSEVGHLNIGAGRIIPQELVRISDAVEDGSLVRNSMLVKVCESVRSKQSKLHLIGLCSDGGVHSHISHLLGLLDLAKVEGIQDVCIHVITDGRDTSPQSANDYLARLQTHIDKVGVGRIVTVSGRYYAMDRDQRWDRVKLAYDVLVQAGAGSGQTAKEVVAASYAAGINDEFILPTRLATGAIEPQDGVIFFNFRPDRARQLTAAFMDPGFKGFDRHQVQPLSFATFTQYDAQIPTAVAFAPQSYSNILGEVIANHGLKQFRAAETEKYPHVTYFFNGGEEVRYPGQEEQMVQSPTVSTYDKAPAMSAKELTQVVTAAVQRGEYALIVTNYANPDMVGHTAKMEATITAIETVDRCVGQLLGAISRAGGTAIITADHGNAELMWEDDGTPCTAHTSNPVPFILVEGEKRKIPGHGADPQLRSDGRLSDIAPTILEILGLPKPPEMTGRSMIVSAQVDIKTSRTPVRLSL